MCKSKQGCLAIDAETDPPLPMVIGKMISCSLHFAGSKCPIKYLNLLETIH